MTTEPGFEWEAVDAALREVDAELGELGEARGKQQKRQSSRIPTRRAL